MVSSDGGRFILPMYGVRLEDAAGVGTLFPVWTELLERRRGVWRGCTLALCAGLVREESGSPGRGSGSEDGAWLPWLRDRRLCGTASEGDGRIGRGVADGVAWAVGGQGRDG